MSKRVGILTGGGDAPGLNAVIRAFVKRAAGQLGWTVVGIEDSFNGLLDSPRRLMPIGPVARASTVQHKAAIDGSISRESTSNAKASNPSPANERFFEPQSDLLDYTHEELDFIDFFQNQL